MINAIRRGSVYWINDQAITLPPNTNRDYHDRRTVIVISGNKYNADPGWDHVLVVPTSSSTGLNTPICVKLGAGVGNLQKKCWARVHMPQPVLKSDLSDFVGELPKATLETIMLGIFEYAGALD